MRQYSADNGESLNIDEASYKTNGHDSGISETSALDKGTKTRIANGECSKSFSVLLTGL